MAPLLSTKARTDDFILTLSDHENGDANDEEVSDSAPLSNQSRPSIKRKLERNSGSTHTTSNRNKKTKLSNGPVNGVVSGSGLDVPALHSDAESGSQVEDDGALNSDFEFQTYDANVGIVDDFDGWEPTGERSETDTGVVNKGLGLDEIIERRRRRPAAGDSVAAREVEDDPSEGSQDVEQEDQPLEDSFQGFDVDADEMLADDAFGMGAPVEGEDEMDDSSPENNGLDDDSHNSEDESEDDISEAAPVPHPDDLASEPSDSEDDVEDDADAARRKAFFAPEENGQDKLQPSNAEGSKSFQTMSLSRPVLKGLAAVGFSAPTPIQAKTIPVALLGKDVVGGAVTGSGKTAAFLVPILERLLYRPKRVPTSRVAILMPTRELAVQCHNVAIKLARFTDITFCRLVGGFSLREQENELRRRPDVIIATPGRFIDHMRNTASFTVETLEILVLDEADRMLEEGFADELNEILTTIPKSRQTMLFSATMTDSVDKLIRVGMTRPVRLMLGPRKQTVGTLVQEFMRLRPGREEKRLAYLILLCESIYTDRTIIFFRQKREAHRVRIIFGLLGFKASELHGSMSQEQRLQSIEAFRNGRVSFLLATDLASRGLDIKGVETVINYEAPQSHEIYLHRVGRTARAGRSGRSCTLAAEPDRKVVKAAVKAARAQGAKIVSRVADAAAVDAWAARLADLDDEVEAVLREEKEEKQLAQAHMQATRGENLILHEAEIMARPKRTWFESEKDKRASRKRGRVLLNGQDDEAPKSKRQQAATSAGKKLSMKERKRLEDREKRVEGKVWKKGKIDQAATSKAAGPGKGKRKKGANGKPAKRNGRVVQAKGRK